MTETDESDNLEREFIYKNYLDEALVMVDYTGQTASDHYYTHDHLFSPAALLDDEGAVEEYYEFDAYGKMKVYYNPGADSIWLTADDDTDTASHHANPISFTGQRLDNLDSNSLFIMYYKNRYYAPDTGRFLQRDPLGYADGMNLYEYTRNAPVVNTDPLGFLRSATILPPAMDGSSVIELGLNESDKWAKLYVDGTMKWQKIFSSPSSHKTTRHQYKFNYNWLKTIGGGKVEIETCSGKYPATYKVSNREEWKKVSTKGSYIPIPSGGVHFKTVEARGYYTSYTTKSVPEIHWMHLGAAKWNGDITIFGDWYFNQQAGEGKGYLYNDVSPFFNSTDSNRKSKNEGYINKSSSIGQPSGSLAPPPEYGTRATLLHPVQDKWFCKFYGRNFGPATLEVTAMLGINSTDGAGAGLARTFSFKLSGRPILTPFWKRESWKEGK
ncbi:MAG: RHS repeat-associated core domain-containing protein [Sedimentisphaerales bacterium]|nr:RHS repeat-associated core domain-containing protein [Sedimentisphaerales bacterium]